MEDDDGFENYVETTVDPGPWMIVATTIYCSLSILLFPCMVSFGRRYEKRRMMPMVDDERNEMAVDDIQAGDEESGVEESRVQVPQQANNKKCNLPRAGSWSSSSFDVSDKPQSSSNADRRKNDDQDQGPIFYVRGGFTDPVGSNKIKRQMQVLIDNVVMPPYQNDYGMSVDIADHGDDSAGITPLDTGAGFRHRHAGARRYRRGQKDQMWERVQEQERRLSLIARGELDARDSAFEETSGDSPAIGLSDERYSTLDPSLFMASNRSTEGSRSASSNQTYLWRTDLRSSIEKPASVSFIQRSSLSGSGGIMPEDAIDANDPGQSPIDKVPMEGEELDLCCGDHAWWKPVMISAAFDRLLDIAEWDRETQRILRLSVPFSISAVVVGISNTVRVGLVAHFIGTDAVAAYTIVDLLLGLTQEFFGGFALTSASLCSHAVGRRNFKLAGEYAQISSILYTLVYIPNVIVWMFFTADIVRLFGFNEVTVQMAQTYARFHVFTLWFEGMDEAYGSFLEVIGHERFTMSLDIMNEIFSSSIIIATCLTGTPSLTDIGIIEVGTEALFYGFSVVLSNLAGWATKYLEGMIRTNALRNIVAVRTVIKTAVPLAIGQLVEYGEWEILTIFVAALGPAEVTAYGIIGVLWDAVEALTEGFGDAGEIRVGYHLGSGHPVQARLSSYKSMFVSVICATVITSAMWIIGEDLAVLLTPDTTLQRLIIEVLPLMGIGNIALTTGTVSWALVGGQGRYRLATFVAFIGSWCVTLPLAAIYTYALNIDLQGVTSAIVIGNAATGTCMMYILVRSDWERISKYLVDLNEESSSSSSSSLSSDKEERSCEKVPN